jgi:hypothetical protein
MVEVVCEYCSVPIQLSTFQTFNKKPALFPLKNHQKRCAIETDEAREYYKRNRAWPPTPIIRAKIARRRSKLRK